MRFYSLRVFRLNFPFRFPARAAASLREKGKKPKALALRQPLARAAALVSRACLRCLERGRTARRGRAARAGRAGTPPRPPVSVAGLWRGGHVCGDVSIGTSLLHTLDHTRYLLPRQTWNIVYTPQADLGRAGCRGRTVESKRAAPIKRQGGRRLPSRVYTRPRHPSVK